MRWDELGHMGHSRQVGEDGGGTSCDMWDELGRWIRVEAGQAGTRGMSWRDTWDVPGRWVRVTVG